MKLNIKELIIGIGIGLIFGIILGLIILGSSTNLKIEIENLQIQLSQLENQTEVLGDSLRKSVILLDATQKNLDYTTGQFLTACQTINTLVVCQGYLFETKEFIPKEYWNL